MAQILHFSASTNVKNLFGQGLVTDQVAAVFELVKNSYDADATEVEITFVGLNSKNPSLIISDNGTGMDLDDIENRWMIIGTDSKKKDLFSPIFNRPLNGDKGIGRFSVDRLGAKLYMESQKRKSHLKYFVKFDWELFEKDSKDIGEIDIPYRTETTSKKNNGVLLKITKLRDDWDDQKIRDLYRNLRQFKSPFSQEDNFKIYINAPEYNYNRREVTVERLDSVSSLWINAEIRADNTEKIFLTVNKDGIEYDIEQENTYSFGAVQAKLFVFNQGDKVRFVNRYGVGVRDYGNIRLYRDDFRIYPYGEAKNDWLDIDRRQTQGIMRFFGTRDLIGYVQISKKDNVNLKPLTNRQGLEENNEFQQLKNFVVDVCIKTLETYHFNKVKKGANETIKKTKSEIGSAISGLNRLAKDIKENSPEVSKQINDFTRTIKKQQESQLKYVKDQQEIVKVYSRIAQKETFLHKLIHQSMIHVNDAMIAIDYFIKANKSIEKEEKMKLIAIQGYIEDALTLLKTVRDDVVKKRSKSLQNIEQLTKKYIRENKAYFDDNDVKVDIKTKGDLMYNIDPGDIKAILNNLSTNAVKSLKKIDDRERKLTFEIYRTERFIILKCTDNGIGIPEEDRERIFDPFHSTTEGFGLGLTIIDEITKEYGGVLELIDTKIGACFSVKLRCKDA